jgi:hypothetical protein
MAERHPPRVYSGGVARTIGGVRWSGEARPAGGRARAGADANQRLTALAGGVLAVLLAVECASGLRIQVLLPVHYFVGLLVVPPVLLKLGSTVWRATRHHLGAHPGARGEPPALALRLLALAVVVTTLVMLTTGVELWLFGLRFGIAWLQVHQLTFVAWFFATGAHVLVHLDGTRRLVTADVTGSDPAPGVVTRRSLVAASLVVGLLLALVSLPWWSPFGLLE